MPVVPAPFQWWLWLLAAMWATTLLVWQRAPLPRDWKWGLAGVVAIYTVLLTAVALPDPSTWTPSRCWFWLSGGTSLAGGLLMVRPSTIGERVGMAIVCAGVAGILMQLGAYVIAGLTLSLGVVVTATALRRASRRQPDVFANAPFAIPNRDAVLIGAVAALVLVGWFGGVRHALTVESHRPGPSQWFTALLSRERIQKWLVTEPGRTAKAAPSPDQQWELLGLAAVSVWVTSRSRRIRATSLPSHE